MIEEEKECKPRSLISFLKTREARERLAGKLCNEFLKCGLLCQKHHRRFDGTKDKLKKLNFENFENFEKSKKAAKDLGGDYLVLRCSSFKKDAKDVFVEFTDFLKDPT